MPILNGFEATKIIKEEALKKSQDVKVIGYTAYWTEKEMEKCKHYGMDDCIPKPSPESILLKVLY